MNNRVTLPKGWIQKELDAVQKQYNKWPEGMKRIARELVSNK